MSVFVPSIVNLRTLVSPAPDTDIDITWLSSPTSVSPAKAVPEVVPKAKELVPAPIAVLTSAPVMPLFNVGVPDTSNRAASPIVVFPAKAVARSCA